MITRWLVVSGLALSLVACSGDEEEVEQKIDYSSFDTAKVQALIDSRDYEFALEIIREQDVMGVADVDDHLQAAFIHLQFYDGIAAEVSIEKARAEGAEEETTALSLSKALIMQRKLDLAEEELAKYIFTGDEAFEAILLRGDIARDRGLVDEARKFYDAAIEDKPDNFRGYTGLALLDLNVGQYDSARTAAVKAAEIAPEDPVVLYALGASEHYRLNFEEAINTLNKAIEIQPNHTLAQLELAATYIDMKQYEDARTVLDTVYARYPEHPMARIYSALIYAIEGDNKTAEEFLLRAADMVQQYPPAIRTYGLVAFQLGKATTAQPYLKRSLELVPEDRSVRLALTESYTRRGMPDKAMETISPLLGEGSTDMEAHMLAAAAAGVTGDMLKVRDWLAKARELMAAQEGIDKEALIRLEKRLALARFSSGDTEQAARQLKALYGEDSSDFTSLTLLANLQMQSGNIQGAEETIQAMQELHADKPVTLNLLGTLRYRQKQFEEAIELYSKALESNPDYFSALKNRGLVYLASGKFEEAIADLEIAHERVPADGHIHGMLGRGYLELGQLKKASEFIQMAEDLFPTSAIILTDHAEILAGLNYAASAISKARKALKYAGNDENLVKYLNEKVAEWNAIEVARMEEQEARQKAIEDAVTEKLKEEARLEAEAKAKAEEEARKAAELEAAGDASSADGAAEGDSEDDSSGDQGDEGNDAPDKEDDAQGSEGEEPAAG